MVSKLSLAGAAVLLVTLGASPLAMAAGSGGSMGGGAPSGSSQREDPAQAYQAGVTALNAREYRDAIRHFRAARRALPNDGTVNYALGLAYVGADDTEEARSAFERAARAENAPAGARLQLGLVHLQLGQRDDAVAQQAELARLIAACDEACGAAKRGQLQTAYDQLTQVLSAPAAAAADPATTGWNFPNVEEGRTAYAAAVGLINQERFPEALEALQRAETAVGPHPDILNYMGFASRKLGRYEAALGYYEQALQLAPNHLGAIEYLGELYVQMGDLHRARSQLAQLDGLCAYGCEQREELARWIDSAR
jgi:tetratricopeptide (TPR) repeat protein